MKAQTVPDTRGLVPGIHVLAALKQEKRGWPGIGERKRRRPTGGYARPRQKGECVTGMV